MRILIIEDDADIRSFLESSFHAEAYAVDTAVDGEEGVRMARASAYDVIVLDNLLPKMTGIEVCRTLRTDGISTPIVVVSVRSEIVTKIDLLDAGADDYLAKPFSFDELAARVRVLLRRPSATVGSVLRVDDLYLDIAKHRVWRGDKDIQLTRKEFMLLEYLMRNAGTALSRMMLMEHVWDLHADPFSNTIETHITTLRRKIESPEKPRLIRTIVGVGYIIEG